MSAENRFIARAEWHSEQGAWSDGGARYLLLRADTLMGMFRHLPFETRQTALEALAAATCEAGGKSLRRYREAAGLDVNGLIPVIERTAAELGWGSPKITVGVHGMTMAVRNSAFAAAAAPAEVPVCAPFTGILSAFAAIAFGRTAQSREVACAATGNDCCRFEVEAR